MKVIDCRSGQPLVIGQTVEYSDGESTTLLEVAAGLRSASARVRLRVRAGVGELDTLERWVPMQVSWTHPGHLLRRVGFLPS